jgi:glycosyltransferase involved in cell wall biosynthesis
VALLVSVLMPLRDAAATVEAAARSVLAQRDVRLELVVVDDGSSDGGVDRLRALGGAERVRIVQGAARGAGRGIAAALTHGLEVARGEIVARMDADDVALPGRLAAQLALLEGDRRLGAVGTRVALLGPHGEGMRAYVEWQNAIVTPEDYARELFVESPMCHPSAMIRREALEDVGGWRQVDWAEDYDLWLRLDARGWRMAKVPEVLLLWRQGRGRTTFNDPRCALARFTEARAFYLAPRLARAGREVVVWGAGQTGKRLARALERRGVRVGRFVDIDPRKIGGTVRGARVVGPDALGPAGEATVVVAVGARGARPLVRARLAVLGWAEGDDFVCAA